MEKAKAGKVTDARLAAMEKRLGLAVDFFGADRDLANITARDCATT